MVDTHD